MEGLDRSLEVAYNVGEPQPHSDLGRSPLETNVVSRLLPSLSSSLVVVQRWCRDTAFAFTEDSNEPQSPRFRHSPERRFVDTRGTPRVPRFAKVGIPHADAMRKNHCVHDVVSRRLAGLLSGGKVYTRCGAYDNRLPVLAGRLGWKVRGDRCSTGFRKADLGNEVCSNRKRDRTAGAPSGFEGGVR